MLQTFIVGSQPKGNLPLFLSCGHSMCETCIGNIIKFAEPIECKVCQRDMEVSPADAALLQQKKIKLYQLFPVNLIVLGDLALQTIEVKPYSFTSIPIRFLYLRNSPWFGTSCIICTNILSISSHNIYIVINIIKLLNFFDYNLKYAFYYI